MSKELRNAVVKIFKLRNLIREEDIDGVELFFVDKPKRSHRVDYSAMAKGH